MPLVWGQVSSAFAAVSSRIDFNKESAPSALRTNPLTFEKQSSGTSTPDTITIGTLGLCAFMAWATNPPIRTLQHEVQQHQVNLVTAKNLKGLNAISGTEYGVADSRQQFVAGIQHT
jgi:hypothetical protein